MTDASDTAKVPVAQGDVTQPQQDTQAKKDELRPLQLLADLRSGGVRAQRARAMLEFQSDGAADALRAAVAHRLVSDIRPSDHTLVRWLLEQETLRLRAAGTGGSEPLYALVAALARFAQPADALVIWRAREATDETRSGVDVEQVGRLGVDAARRYLRSVSDAGGAEAGEAVAALVWVDDGLAAGAFADLPGYFAWADERFGLHVSGPV